MYLIFLCYNLYLKALAEYTGFIKRLNEMCKDTKLTDTFDISPMAQSILNMLVKLSQWVDEIPPIQQPQRFGNKAFKNWLDKVREVSRFIVLNPVLYQVLSKCIFVTDC